MSRERARRAVRRWVASRSFPGKRRLLVDQHLLPFARLAWFARLLEPRPGEAVREVVEAVPGTLLEVDLRSAAQRAVAYRLSDESELALIRSIVRPGDVAVDAGANIGLFTTSLARAVGEAGGVHAFEPNPETFQQLERNVRLNGLSNVHLNRLALSDSSGSAMLRSPVANEPGLASLSGEGDPVAEVTVTTLDEYSTAADIETIAFLKLDVEGAELDALRGAQGLVEDGRVRRILFEVLQGSTAVQAHLGAYGFQLFALTNDPSSPTRPCRPDERFAYANLLAVAPGAAPE